MSSVTIENVTKAFGSTVVLEKFDAVFENGEFITLLGPSGCGKTTMLRIVAGFEKPTAGTVRFDDRVVSSEKVFLPPEKRDIGMVFQSYAVWPHMTVYENVAYPLTIKKVDKAAIKQKVDRVLAAVHLSQYADRIPSQLSGGQQQRVALARALVAEPALLLLDEPLSNLDAKLRESMRFEIKEIQKEYGITVMYVTHDQTEAMAMSDRIVVINRGVIQQIGSPREIYTQPANPFVADFVGKIEFVEGIAKDGVIELNGCGQKLPYDGELKGEVIVGIRPEQITYAAEGEGELSGVVKTHFYLGDVDDCRIDLGGGAEVRVIADPFESRGVSAGKQVSLKVRNFHVFAKQEGEDFRKILT
ncbi:MAG: ABC transporter ATP-binding protein [Clostridia bacterium]|nr:ABC transporter ATP-binding protein [Clostridia bacterium]